nr:TlpA disulfide reductase family protein [Pedobacter panaciterrae]
MKSKILILLAGMLFTLPVYSAKIRGSRVGATATSAGFFVEAYSAQGRILFKSLKFDEEGKFVLEYSAKEPLLYWIDNFPVYIRSDEDLDIVLPEKNNTTFVLGGPADQKTISPGMVNDSDIKIAGKSEINNLLINQINAIWLSLGKEKDKSIADIGNLYLKVTKIIADSKGVEIKALGKFYNDIRYLESKLQYLRAHPDETFPTGYFDLLSEISLNDPAINTLKPIGIKALVSNYYMFKRLGEGASIQDEDLTDNSSLGKMKFLLKTASNNRIIDEELNQSIVYHLSIRGWNPELDKVIVSTIEKTSNPEAKKNLIDLREKYSKISKNSVAPDFSIPDASGKQVKLSDFRGKIVAIDVWATWCVPCMHSLPYFLNLRDKYKDNQNIVFMSISTDNDQSKSKWLKFLKSKNMNGVDLHAGDKSASAFEKAYNITGIPRYILIDANGKIIEDHAVAASEPEYEKLIETALKSK